MAVAAKPKYAEAAKNEEPISTFVPYSNHVTRSVVKLKTGDYVAVIRMQGAAHESADAQDINVWHDQLNNFMRNIASPNVALWSHVVRREYGEFPAGEFAPGFAHDLNEKYRKLLAGQRSLGNELYLTVVYRPQPVKALKIFDLFSKKSAQELQDQQAAEIQVDMDLVNVALASLDRYELELLSCDEHHGIMFSGVREFLSFLFDEEWR